MSNIIEIIIWKITIQSLWSLYFKSWWLMSIICNKTTQNFQLEISEAWKNIPLHLIKSPSYSIVSAAQRIDLWSLSNIPNPCPLSSYLYSFVITCEFNFSGNCKSVTFLIGVFCVGRCLLFFINISIVTDCICNSLYKRAIIFKCYCSKNVWFYTFLW